MLRDGAPEAAIAPQSNEFNPWSHALPRLCSKATLCWLLGSAAFVACAYPGAGATPQVDTADFVGLRLGQSCERLVSTYRGVGLKATHQHLGLDTPPCKGLASAEFDGFAYGTAHHLISQGGPVDVYFTPEGRAWKIRTRTVFESGGPTTDEVRGHANSRFGQPVLVDDVLAAPRGQELRARGGVKAEQAPASFDQVDLYWSTGAAPWKHTRNPWDIASMCGAIECLKLVRQLQSSMPAELTGYVTHMKIETSLGRATSILTERYSADAQKELTEMRKRADGGRVPKS